MKLATIGEDYASRSIALVREHDVVDVSGPMATAGLGQRDLGEVLSAGPDAWMRLLDVARGADNGHRGIPIASVSFQVPVPRPQHVIAVAANYRAHIEETGTIEFVPGTETNPWLFNKPQSSLNPHRAAVRLPRLLGERVDWEAELGVVIGQPAHDVPVEEALTYVAGYTVVNDISARRMNVPSRTMTRPRDVFYDWLHGKWFDTFCCVGPWIVTPDEVAHPGELEITLDLNGKTMQRASTRDMIFPTEQLISFISKIVTLMPGDIIATGTPAGVGKARNRFLQPGDTMTASVEVVGSLTNSVVADE
ncbi:fumarylacetoacetate hydrolase family protein [Rhizomonospora bruguierae]|uniref:fumarylacetoacetate hydrolase family protein n=1 Tax=Rhizomonospora bruguierae TaxID=1581705 RepID=UPI001BCC3AC1|nr:fumarylacetoacetate hydrolase family protein [Micromonospora sp. NBRC 107566]